MCRPVLVLKLYNDITISVLMYCLKGCGRLKYLRIHTYLIQQSYCSSNRNGISPFIFYKLSAIGKRQKQSRGLQDLKFSDRGWLPAGGESDYNLSYFKIGKVTIILQLSLRI